MHGMIELRHLHYVIATAEHGSFNRAAALFNIKQSTLSERVRDLEIRLGIALFDRSSRGVALTRAGTNFLIGARRVITEIEAMTRHASAYRAGKAGLLVIGIAGAVPRSEVEKLLISFTRANRDVCLETCRGPHMMLGDRLRNGRLDAMISTQDVAGRDLRCAFLASARLFAAVDANGPLGTRDHLRWSDLLDSDILLPAGDRGEDLKDKALRSIPIGVCRPLIREHGMSSSAVIRLVEGRAITLIDENDLQFVQAAQRAIPIHDDAGLARLPSIASWSVENANPALAELTRIIAAGNDR
jgi:DNA-binding transcriptional LysR family regulator